MPDRARRLSSRLCRTLARRAWLLASLCLAGAAAAEDDIRKAWYTEPTTRYGHDVLGGGGEWGALTMQVVRADGGVETRNLVLPDTRVFEDIAPRLHDLDGDGRAEVIAVESDVNQGARLVVIGPTGVIAATPFIGRANRWLAPLGAADLDGDGVTEIAYIDRPHLARLLRIWRYENGQLTHVADRAGLTNHRIGEDFISGGIRTCDGQPEILTADSSWSRVLASTLQGRQIDTRDIGPFRGRQSFDAALDCR